MNFKEAYQNEMDTVRHNNRLDDEILELQEGATVSGRQGRRSRLKVGRVALVAAALLVVFVAFRFEACVGWAEEMLGRFHLTAGNQDVELDSVQEIPFDLAGFSQDEQTDSYENGIFRKFDRRDELFDLTGVELPGNYQLHYSDIVLDVNEEYGMAHLTMTVTYQTQEYAMNGTFAIQGYDGEETGYGFEEDDKPRIKDTYTYGDDKKAYFVIEPDSDFYEVYFTEGNIMFQLFVSRDSQGKNAAKQIIDCMVEDTFSTEK